MSGKAEKIVDRLIEYYGDGICELEFSSTYELVVAVILSAQCTDKRVNIVTKELFKVANTPRQMLNLGESNLKQVIRPCGFFNNKAKNIIEMSRVLIQKYGGEVPCSRSELVSLAGVGEKVASVVLAVGFGIPAIAVDTHVYRLSKRLGLCDESTPTKTMQVLEKLLSKEKWIKGHFALVRHGRTFCKAIKPDCENCPIKDLCPKK